LLSVSLILVYSFPLQASANPTKEARKLVSQSCDKPVRLNPPIPTEDGTGVIFDLNTAIRIQFVLDNCVPLWKGIIKKQDERAKLLIENVRSSTTALAGQKTMTEDTKKWGQFWKDQWEDATNENIFEVVFGSNELWLLMGVGIGAGAVALAESRDK
jgi:hypothetical protein